MNQTTDEGETCKLYLDIYIERDIHKVNQYQADLQQAQAFMVLLSQKWHARIRFVPLDAHYTTGQYAKTVSRYKCTTHEQKWELNP